ncbi:MAG: type II toxin-antitoxin system VapC family toxin [Spirochaetaceae bacterium]|nr:type II toxin-antitoxin system VapC family toxin [Spirochaetaceae bacterium]
MKLLIDTHLLLWAAADTLPKKALPYFKNKENELLFSSATIWEVIIKKSLNRADFQIDPTALYWGLLDNGYSELSITSRHALLITDLPQIHKDPFDRILIAQAKAEGIALLTSDKSIAKYSSVILIE